MDKPLELVEYVAPRKSDDPYNTAPNFDRTFYRAAETRSEYAANILLAKRANNRRYS